MDTSSGKSSMTAREKRQAQLQSWNNSETDLQPKKLKNLSPRVKFDERAVFLAACSSGDIEEIGHLLQKGSDINCANVDGLTALHQACIDDKLHVVKFLVEKEIQVDQQDNEGWTPLHAAVSCGFLDIARFLVKNGANVAAVNSEGEIPSDLADEDDNQMKEYLNREVLNQGLDIDGAKNYERKMMMADAKHLLDIKEKGQGVQAYHHPKSGATPLHVAAAKGYNEVMRCLLQVGLNVNALDFDNWTPLHAASHWGHEKAAKILADNGADFDAKSKLGQTPFDVADDEMIKYMDRLKTQQQFASTQKTPLSRRDDVKRAKIVLPVDDVTSVSSQSDSEESSASSDVVATTTTPAASQKTSLTAAFAAPLMSQRRIRPNSIHVSSPNSTGVGFDSETRRAMGVPDKPTVVVQPNERNENLNLPHLRNSSTRLRKTESFDDKKSNAGSTPMATGPRSVLSMRHSGDGDTTTQVPRLRFSSEKDGSANKTAIVNPRRDDRNKNYSSFASMFGQPIQKKNYSTTDLTTPESNSDKKDEDKLSILADLPGSKDKRRSHLQPVRDEEAEAQRKARSRRERQARRSTQGVTLDVYEEAKQLVQQKREKRDQKRDQKSSTSSINNESEDKSAASRSRPEAALGPNLPAGYVPFGQRAKQDPVQENKPTEDATRNLSTRSHVAPAASVSTTTTNNTMATTGNISSKHQRQRGRRNRPSTGIDKNVITSLLEGRREELNENSAENNENSQQVNRLAPQNNSTSNQRCNNNDGSGDSYKKMYQDKCGENDMLRKQLEEMRKKIETLEGEVERRRGEERKMTQMKENKTRMDEQISKLEKRHEEEIKEKSKRVEELEDENVVLKKLIDKMTIQNCDVTKDSKTGKTKPPFVTSSSRNLTSSRPASSSRSNDFNGKRTPYMDRKVSSQVGVRPGSEGLVRSSRLQSHSTPSSKYVGASPSAATAGSFGSRKYLSSNPMTSSSYRTTSSVPTSSSTSSSKRPSFFRTAWKF